MCRFREPTLRVLATATIDLTTVNCVRDLTNDTFRDFVDENDIVVVGFVLPFLPVSERFLREYEEV